MGVGTLCSRWRRRERQVVEGLGWESAGLPSSESEEHMEMSWGEPGSESMEDWSSSVSLSLEYLGAW